MSKNWYPMINYENCTECGSCIEFCSHGVYDEEKAPTPKVINPEGCIEGCKGCAGICPADAITYFGDSEERETGGGCCSGDCDCGDNGGGDCDCDDNSSDDECGCDKGCGCGDDSCC